MCEKASVLLEKVIHIKLGDTETKLLDKYAVTKNYPKNSIVLVQGDYSDHIYFIIKGIVRAYYIDENGMDITKSFAGENEFFSTKGLISNASSYFHVECLENCECIQIPYKIVNQLMEQNNDLFKVLHQYVITSMEALELRTRDLVMKSAKERYRSFLKEYSWLEQRVNQKHIASYLGIKASSLCRIKKQIKQEKLT
jgi:cAMP-binding proteins - catabolite gene activator and regulatory subunit of cAMP-dependent protein kinases